MTDYGSRPRRSGDPRPTPLGLSDLENELALSMAKVKEYDEMFDWLCDMIVKGWAGRGYPPPEPINPNVPLLMFGHPVPEKWSGFFLAKMDEAYKRWEYNG